MEIKPEEIGGIGGYTAEELTGRDGKKLPGKVYLTEGRAFLVVRPTTIEVRIDRNLAGIMTEKYETVMKSRYFGRGGIEIVTSGQIPRDELLDLARLSYNITTGKA